MRHATHSTRSTGAREEQGTDRSGRTAHAVDLAMHSRYEVPSYHIPSQFEVWSEHHQRPALDPLARHDAPAAPARFASRKLREGRKVLNAIRTVFAAKKRRYKNYEKLRGIFQIDAHDELGDSLGKSVL